MLQLSQQLGWQQQRLWKSLLKQPAFLHEQHGEQLEGVQQLLVQQLGWQQLDWPQLGWQQLDWPQLGWQQDDEPQLD